MPTGETLPGALSHHSPCSEKMHPRSAETARLGVGRGKREQGAPERKAPGPCLLPGELESLQIKSSGKAQVIINSSRLNHVTSLPWRWPGRLFRKRSPREVKDSAQSHTLGSWQSLVRARGLGPPRALSLCSVAFPPGRKTLRM